MPSLHSWRDALERRARRAARRRADRRLPLARLPAVAAPRRRRRRAGRSRAARRAAVGGRRHAADRRRSSPRRCPRSRPARGSSAPTTTRTAPRAPRRSTAAARHPHRRHRPARGHLNPEAGYGPWPAVEAWCLRRRRARSAAERQHELPDRAGIAVREAAVLAVEQVERVRHAERVELGARTPARRGRGSTRRCARRRGRCGASSAARRRARGAIRTGSLSSHCAQTSSSRRPVAMSNGSSALPGLAGSGE